jgi:hypothetical protein
VRQLGIAGNEKGSLPVSAPDMTIANEFKQGFKNDAFDFGRRLSAIGFEAALLACVAIIHHFLDALITTLFGSLFGMGLHYAFTVAFSVVYASGLYAMVITICPALDLIKKWSQKKMTA